MIITVSSFSNDDLIILFYCYYSDLRRGLAVHCVTMKFFSRVIKGTITVTAQKQIELNIIYSWQNCRSFCVRHEFPATLFTIDIRYKIEPREEFHYIARSFLKDRTLPMSITHIK